MRYQPDVPEKAAKPEGNALFLLRNSRQAKRRFTIFVMHLTKILIW